MYTPATVAVSLILIAVGAILAWAVTDEPEGLDLTVVGVVLMLVGLVALLLTLLTWSSWRRPAYRRRVYTDAAPVRRTAVVEEPPAYPTRRVDVVEEEEVPPAGPPGPPGPPPP